MPWALSLPNYIFELILRVHILPSPPLVIRIARIVWRFFMKNDVPSKILKSHKVKLLRYIYPDVRRGFFCFWSFRHTAANGIIRYFSQFVFFMFPKKKKKLQIYSRHDTRKPTTRQHSSRSKVISGIIFCLSIRFDANVSYTINSEFVRTKRSTPVTSMGVHLAYSIFSFPRTSNYILILLPLWKKIN